MRADPLRHVAAHIGRGMPQISVVCAVLIGLCWPVVDANAQAPNNIARIGYLDGAGLPQWFEVFQPGLSDLGYVENRSIVIERRSAAGQAARLPELAGRVGAVLVLSGPMAFANRDRIVAAAARHQGPAIYYDGEYAASGGLLSYGPGLANLHRRAAVYVERILKRARPGDIPIELPTTFELTVNVRAAKAMGLVLPPAVLYRADELIE